MSLRSHLFVGFGSNVTVTVVEQGVCRGTLTWMSYVRKWALRARATPSKSPSLIAIPSVYDTSEKKYLFGQKTKIFINSWRPLRTGFRSDKLIIYSGFEGENRNELQARQCEPPGRVLEAPVPS